MKGGGLEKTADLEGPKCLKMLPIERQTDMKDEEPDPEVRHTFFPSHSTYMIVPAWRRCIAHGFALWDRRWPPATGAPSTSR